MRHAIVSGLASDKIPEVAIFEELELNIPLIRVPKTVLLNTVGAFTVKLSPLIVVIAES